MFLSFFIGVINSENPKAGLYGILKITEYLYLGIYIITSFENLSKKYILSILFFGVIFESALSFLQVFKNGSLNGIFYFLGERFFNSQTPGIANASVNGQLLLRPYATFSHPNALAGYLIFAMTFIATYKKHVSLKILFLTILIGSMTLLLTLSRIAILIWTAYLMFLFYLPFLKKYKKSVSSKSFTTGLLSVVLLIILTFYFFQNTPLAQRFTKTKIAEESFVQREYLINQSLNMFNKNPVFGAGINNYYNNLEKSKEKTLFIQPVHNIFLLALSQTGLIGFVYFLFIFYKALKSPFVKNQKINSFFLTLLLIILGMSDHYFLTVQQGQIMFVLILSHAFSVKIRK